MISFVVAIKWKPKEGGRKKFAERRRRDSIIWVEKVVPAKFQANRVFRNTNRPSKIQHQEQTRSLPRKLEPTIM
jgi:hypothetical protein